MAVYFVQVVPDGAIKIGYADRSVEFRLGHLQIGCPYPLRIIATIPSGTLKTERELHQLFNHIAFGGEWFYPDTSLLEFIATHATPYPQKPPRPPRSSTLVMVPPTLKRPEIDEFVGRYNEDRDAWVRAYIGGESLQDLARRLGFSPSMLLAEMKRGVKQARRWLDHIDKVLGLNEQQKVERQRLYELAGLPVPDDASPSQPPFCPE